MKRSDSILQNYYMSKLPKYQQRPGTVDEDAVRAYMMGLPGRAPKQLPKGLTQLSAKDIQRQQYDLKYRAQDEVEQRRLKAVEEEERRRIAEGKAAERTRESVIRGNADVPFTFPTGETKLWKDMDWREKQYVSGKNLGSTLRFNNWTDYINPLAMIGDLGEGLATAPYVARETNSVLPYITGVGAPLLVGSLAGIGAPKAGQFIENIVSPVSGVGEYLTTRTPLKNAWKLNPYAYKQQADMMYRGIGKEGFQDAIDAGYLRSKQNVEPSYYKNLNMSKQFGKNTYFSPNVETAVQYGEGVVAAIPRSSARWISRYPRQGANSWSQFTQSQIPTEMVEFYKPHWLKRLTPIKNPVTPKTYPTIWSDLQGMTPTNVGEVLDLPGNISNDIGDFNYGVFPTKKNPNILVKLENLNRYKELVDPNASIQSGLPELMRDITSPNISKSYMDIDLSNREFLKAIRPDINTVYNNPQIAGRVMSRVQGSPLDALLPSEMENIPTEAYQTFLDDIRMLSKKNIGLDLVGENIVYNPETKRFGMFDLAKLPTETGNTGLSLHDLYGIGNTGNISNYRIQQYFQNKMKSALSDVTSANAGEYAPNVYSSALDKIYENIRKIKKQGGPIINQRGFMDGVPPQGSNWRIMGDGQGTSITMDLPNMPDEILVVPDGDFGQAKVMKQGEEEYFMGADFVDEYLLKDGGLTPNKAREILHDKEVHGRPLTEKQRRYFGAMSKGHTKKYQIGGKTDEEKRALAKRTVQIARRRADKGEWVDVPESIREAADKLGEPSFSCIGGVCDVLKEANVIPNVIWSNTEFARLAPSLGFNAANRGWGLKGIENLEPGDVVQWMDPNEKNPNKAVPHHGQIYLGTNSKGELEFFDNFSETVKSYPRERIEEQLSWTRKPAESQMQIYKINPYNPKPGNVNPEAQKALEEREANLRYQTGYEGNLPEYAYSLRPDSPYINNPPVGMVKFLEKANDSGFIDDLVKSIDKAGYAKRATREQIHDSLLNVFGILGEENKWDNPWVGGDITGGRSPIPIPLESTVERIASPSTMSIGPGQIKFSQINKAVKKAFGINRRQDLQKWDKVIPLMVGLDIANKQWMENQGERFSERIIGQPGLRSTEFKWDEGRISPYFFRGPGIKNIRKYVESLYGKDWYDKFKPQYMQDVEEMEEDPAKREQFVKDNIRQYQLVFDPGSYGQRVFENINKNLQRKILRKGEIDIEAEPMDAITLQEVILNSKRPPSRQLGGNALGMLRDYGGGISIPPKYQQRPGTVREPIIVSDPQDRRLTRYNDSLALYNNYVYNKNLIESTLRPQFKKMGYRDIKKYTEPYNSDRNFFELPDGSSTVLSYGKNERVTAPQYKTDTDVANPRKVVRRKVGTITVPEHEQLWSTSIAPVRTIRYNPADVLYTNDKNFTGDIYSIDNTELVPYNIRQMKDSPRKRQMLKERAEFVKSWPYIITPTKSNYSFLLDEYVKPVQPVIYQQLVTKLEKLKEPEPTVKNKTPLIDYFQGTSVFAPTPYHGSGAGAFVGYRTPQGDTVFVKPEDYERMGVPKYGREFIESQIKKQKNGGQHGGLDRWFAEKWVDVKTGKPCGRQEGESRAYPACRPSKRVSSKTPKTSSELSSAEKEKFKRSKTSSERIPYSHKRRK